MGDGMKNLLNKNYFGIENLESFLFSTLDEKLFFDTLSEFLKKEISVDRVLAYYFQGKDMEGKDTLKLISTVGKKGPTPKGFLINEGSGGYVLRTKRPYFSNNVKRDLPLRNYFKNKHSIKKRFKTIVIHLNCNIYIFYCFSQFNIGIF